MIILTHNDGEVYDIVDLKTNQLIFNTSKNPSKALFILASKFKERILIWSHVSQKENINIKALEASFHLKNMMLSYSKNQYLPNQIGYVEDSPFLKVNKSVKYPTWFMSSEVGAIYASELLKFRDKICLNNSFDFVLNSIAKLGMPNGLFCYSEPKLLFKTDLTNNEKVASNFELFKFVKQHYKPVWSFLLLVNFMVNESKFKWVPFLYSIFYKKINFNINFSLNSKRNTQPNINPSIDIIIPTLGRKTYLHDVLLDLEKQILLPKQVIIIEQNEDINSKSELDFISNKAWPFKIVHKFIHQTGACNARNMALKEVTSDYVFFADDDIRIEPNLIESTLFKMQVFNFKAVTLSCLQENDVKIFFNAKQWSTFGSGCSIVNSKPLKTLRFDMNYEFSFGEDADFGMQLRNSGTDIIYFPKPAIKHIKAPIGGFRKPFKHIWTLKGDQPKPSPTILFYKLRHQTNEQLNGYKLVLFFKFYRVQTIKSPIKYYKTFTKQWQQSFFWANKMISHQL